MGQIEKQANVRVFWDLNDTLLECTKQRPRNLIDYPFTEGHLEACQRIIELPYLSVDERLQAYHDFIDPDMFRRLERIHTPEFARWGFLGSATQRDLKTIVTAKAENWLNFGRYYRKYVKPYRLTAKGLHGVESSYNLGFENSIVSSMPWNVREPLMSRLELIMDYLSRRYGVLLNPDLKRVSGGYLKPKTWMLGEAGLYEGRKEFPVVVDDDDYINRLAEHFGLLVFSTISESDAKKDRDNKFSDFPPFPGKKNGNGQIIYDCPLEEIPARIQKELGLKR